jgi:hypothetical protein
LLLFTKLLIIFALILLIVGAAVYYTGYHFSGNPYLRYYPAAGTPSASSFNFVQNGNTTIKYLGIFMIVLCMIFLAIAVINQILRISEKYHHLKYSKPLH